MGEQRPVRVAIIGGGCASITAAFELSRPEHQGKYKVTVYQLGWRLGGKGASGRGPNARIEEHGFHVWLGFYENAFRLMRECYAELGRDPHRCRVADWRDAFVPAPFIGLADQVGESSFDTLLLYFPPGEGFPGDPVSDNNPFTINSYMTRMASVLRSMITSIRFKHDRRVEAPASTQEGLNAQASEQVDQLGQRIARLIRLGLLATSAGLIEALGLVEIMFAGRGTLPPEIVQLLEAIAAAARRQFEQLVRGDRDLTLLWHGVDLGLTCMLGIMRAGLLSDPRGFDAINHYDFREWLRVNGASESSINSPIVRCAYDIAFAYEDGDYRRPRHGAGVGLRGSLRLLFTYRGAVVWKMTAGMGDIVFAPLYEVLKKRGVGFEFFHRLERVKLSEGGPARGRSPHVESLVFDLQARVKGGGEYQPLIDINGLPCWPSSPDYSQLVDDTRLERERWKFESHWDRRRSGTRTLRVGRDFDAVVLGVGLGVIPHVCRQLVERDPRWRDMVTHLKTVETQAFQLWMREDLETLGWDHPPGALTGFVQPFESWFDMRHLVSEEEWSHEPKSIVYFCSTLRSPSAPGLSETDYPSRRAREVKANAIHYLDNHIGCLWPNSRRNDGGFRWDLLIDPNEAGTAAPISTDKSRFDSQFWIANVDPAERYSLSLPGTQQYRISPLDNTYDNLTIAGDWTACGLDSGCVESAVISGRLAAHAISSSPPLEEIVGYDHP